MARAKRKTTRRPKYKGAFKVMPIIFSLATLNVMARTLFNNSLPAFLLGGYAGGYSASGGSSNIITLKEIFAGGNLSGSSGAVINNLGQSIGQNVRANALTGIMGLVGIKVAQKLVVSLGINRSFNRLSGSLGLASTVRAN